MSKSSMFIIQGRQKGDQLEMFLRSLNLDVFTWAHAHEIAAGPGSPTPRTWEIATIGIERADVVIGLMTPDDEVRLSSHCLGPGEQPFDVQVWGQSRPNVLMEIGYALGVKPRQTVLVQMGRHRIVTDLGGHYILNLDKTEERRSMFINALRAAGCEPDLSEDSWKWTGDFDMVTPLTSYRHHPFQGVYQGTWVIENFQQLEDIYKRELLAVSRKAASRREMIRIQALPPPTGDAEASVMPSGDLIAHLQYGSVTGTLHGRLNHGGAFEGKSSYPGEPEVRVSGAISRNSFNQLEARIIQNLPYVDLNILARLNNVG